MNDKVSFLGLSMYFSQKIMNMKLYRAKVCALIRMILITEKRKTELTLRLLKHVLEKEMTALYQKSV